MFAIDGVKLPSNASKTKSGTRADFLREAAKMQAQVNKMLERHRSRDQSDAGEELEQREARHIQRLTRDAQGIQRWLEDNPHDRPGAKNGIRQSNRTDNQSAKMSTEKGVIQGYTAVAAVDDKHQIIVQAQASMPMCWPTSSFPGVSWVACRFRNVFLYSLVMRYAADIYALLRTDVFLFYTAFLDRCRKFDDVVLSSGMARFNSPNPPQASFGEEFASPTAEWLFQPAMSVMPMLRGTAMSSALQWLVLALNNMLWGTVLAFVVWRLTRR